MEFQLIKLTDNPILMTIHLNHFLTSICNNMQTRILSGTVSSHESTNFQTQSNVVSELRVLESN